MSDERIIAARVRAAWVRRCLGRTVAVLLRFMAVGLAACVLFLAVDRLWGPFPASGGVLIALFVLPALAAIIWALIRMPGMEDTAKLLDDRLGLKDRISSALYSLHAGLHSQVIQAQVKDASRHAKDADLKKALPPSIPRELVFILPLAFCFIVLFFLPGRGAASVAHLETKEAAFPKRDIERLRERGRELSERSKETGDKETAKLAEELKRLASALEKQELSEKEALAKLSELSERIRAAELALGAKELKHEFQKASSALMRAAATRETAAAIQRKQWSKVRKSLKQLAAKLKAAKLSAEECKELQGALSDAASKLSKSSSRLKGALSKASDNLRRSQQRSAGSEIESASDQASLIERSQMLSQLKSELDLAKLSLSSSAGETCPSCGQKQGAGGCKRCRGKKKCPCGCVERLEAERKKLAKEAEDAARRAGRKDITKAVEEALAKANIEVYCPCSQCSACGGGKGGLPAGTAPVGLELARSPRMKSETKTVVVKGKKGAGPTASRTTETPGTRSKPSRDYKDLYSEYKKVMEESVETEDIPLGERLHVKRYFEAIKPTD